MALPGPSPMDEHLVRIGAAAGDLVFFGRDVAQTGEEFVDAILAAARNGRGIFHCGIVVEEERGGQLKDFSGIMRNEFGNSLSLRIVHADDDGVLLESLDAILARCRTDTLEVYAVTARDASTRVAAAEWARARVGATYNDVFSPECVDSKGREAYYCSQLITEAYKDIDVGFPEHKMAFAGSDGEVSDYWKQYFSSRGRPVPIGEEGSHPARLVEAARLEMLLSIRFASSFVRRERGRYDTLHWLDGAACALRYGAEFDVVEPRSGKIISRCAAATEQQTEEAVDVAKRVQREWAGKEWAERGRVLGKTAELIRDHIDWLADLECRDNGKPISEAKADVASCADTFEFYAGIGPNLAGAYFPLESTRYAYTTREPLGVVGCIGAWNFPMQTCSWKTAPALAAGNSVVYKPSPLSPVSAVVLGELLAAAGLPRGVYNVIQGDAVTGAALAKSSNVDKISFTGSTVTGKRIMQDCASRAVKPLTLELGGKSSLVILDDADLESAVAGAMIANFFSQGQVCTNASKVLVHKSHMPAFQERLVELTRKMKVGDPLDVSTRVGAHISREHLEKVKAYIDGAVAAGATLLCGGERVRVPLLEDGFFLSPCVLGDVTEDMAVYKEEIFGSVLLLVPFESDDEALRIANDTDTGLAAGVFTKSLSRAHHFASRLRAGNVYVNSFNDVSPLVPFGGIGQSGFGRENGLAALEHYTAHKAVFVSTADRLPNSFVE